MTSGILENRMRPFLVGDRVSFGGGRGTVARINGGSRFSVNVHFDGGGAYGFTPEGFFDSGHTKPLLKHLKKKKTMVTKTVECWANIYPNGHMCRCDSKSEADMIDRPDRIACVRMVGTYEVLE